MHRRAFLATSLAAAAAPSPLEVALITHRDGPHLGAYVEGLARCTEAARVHLCDTSADPATEASVRKGLGTKLAAQVHRTPAGLFAAHRPPLALITMEARLAPPAIEAALRAGCHVMAEKPACVRASDFQPLVERANAGKRHLMLALANRVDPVMLEARRLVQSGVIGNTLYGMELHTIADQTRLTKPAYHQSWTAQKSRSGGGHLMWLGIHWLDLAMFITGSPIAEVAAFTGNVGGQPLDTEDSAALSFRFANRTFGTLTSGYYLDKGKQLFIKVWGSHGWLEINHGTANPLEWYSTRETPAVTRQYQPPRDAASGYNAWVTHVVRAAAGLEPPALSPDESYRALRTVFTAYAAAESRRTLEVSH